jgi:hypothetical protein
MKISLFNLDKNQPNSHLGQINDSLKHQQLFTLQCTILYIHKICNLENPVKISVAHLTMCPVAFKKRITYDATSFLTNLAALATVLHEKCKVNISNNITSEQPEHDISIQMEITVMTERVNP